MEVPSNPQSELQHVEQQIEQLQSAAANNQEALKQLEGLQERVEALRRQISGKLTPWERTELARHPMRPYPLDYVERIFPDFSEVHGDRNFGDDPAMVCGMARFKGREVAVLGTQKGRDTKQRVYRNFGQPNPEGHREAAGEPSLSSRLAVHGALLRPEVPATSTPVFLCRGIEKRY